MMNATNSPVSASDACLSPDHRAAEILTTSPLRKGKQPIKLPVASPAPSPFLRLAIIAAETENAGAYAFAAATWLAASELARQPSNKRWAEDRSNFCENALMRGWGIREDKEED
ncbi:ANR family transcriptional regulator [Pantoea sp. NPDC088449]|uniref:ANR family transcriptional regulator n=1 Tax=Pantoea sp. NPDC088449 TaxID=3364392 RepID=UPI0037FE65A3